MERPFVQCRLGQTNDVYALVFLNGLVGFQDLLPTESLPCYFGGLFDGTVHVRLSVTNSNRLA